MTLESRASAPPSPLPQSVAKEIQRHGRRKLETAAGGGQVGFWGAGTAAEGRDAGRSPENAGDASRSLVHHNGADAFTDGSPIYAACNSDIFVDSLIEAKP